MPDQNFRQRIQAIAYGNYRSDPATGKQLRAVNILMGNVTTERSLRLYILSWLFERTFNTSKELTISEAKSIIELGFDDAWQPVPAFLTFLKEAYEVDF